MPSFEGRNETQKRSGSRDTGCDSGRRLTLVVQSKVPARKMHPSLSPPRLVRLETDASSGSGCIHSGGRTAGRIVLYALDAIMYLHRLREQEV